MAYFDGLTTTQVTALTTDQMSVLSTTDVASLTTTQVVVLSTSQVLALPSTSIPGLTTTTIATLSTTQVQALEVADFTALSTTQAVALSTTQLAAMQVPDIAGFTTSQFGAFSTNQVAALNSAGIAKLDLGFSKSEVTGRQITVNFVPPNPVPVAIPTGTTWSSGLFPFDGFNAAVAAILADKILTVTVQRYMDSTGLLPVGAAGTLTSTANTAGYTSALSINVPATYLKVTVANASGTTAIVSKFAIGLQAN